MGCSVSELLNRMSSYEITEWLAFYQIKNEEAKEQEKEMERKNKASSNSTGGRGAGRGRRGRRR